MASLTNPRGLLVSLFLVAAVAVVGVVALFWRQSASPPTAELVSLPPVLGARPTLHLKVHAEHGNLEMVEISAVQAGQRRSLGSLALPDTTQADLEMWVPIDVAAAGLEEGEATVEVHARDDFWRPRGQGEAASFRAPVQLDLTPPRVSVMATTRYPEPGGAGVAVLRATDAEDLAVRVDDREFLAYPDPGGAESTWVVFYALPIDHDPQVQLLAVARDEAGNETTAVLPAVLKQPAVRTGSVNLDGNWLSTKLPELLGRGALAPDEIAEAFLEVSVDQRAQAARTRHSLATQSAPQPLWKGVFLQMPNASALSNFGVRRTYRYEGRDLDTKDHEGYDLASVRHAPVPAANAGIVVFAGPLTLYGNAVIVDHGMGLMTLYGHCSSLEVEVGQRVERGQTLARTGATGLAMGDHLHFEVVVGGAAVNPLQWWDAKWIRDHVEQPLKDGGARIF